MQSEIHWHNKIPEKQPIFTNFITEEPKIYLSEVLRQPYNKNHRWLFLRYIRLQEGDDIEEYLFDLEQDPAEKINILGKRKEDVRKLKILLKNLEEKVKHKR